MNNQNLLFAALDILLALVIVFVANFALANYSNTGGNSVNTVDEILRIEILDDYPELNKEYLNYVAFYVRSDSVQIIDIVKGDNKNEKTISSVNELTNWFYSKLNYLRKNKKNLAIYEAEENNTVVSVLLRLATENDIPIGYANARN